MQRSIANAKAKLSELIRAAHARGEVIITDRGRPVAKLVAYKADEPATLDARLAAFEERGLLRRTSDETPKAPWPPAQRKRGALARFLRDRG